MVLIGIEWSLVGCLRLTRRDSLRLATRGPARAQIRRKMTLPFVPPKPKELEIAASIFMLRAWFGT
jgi:hypothetical protein